MKLDINNSQIVYSEVEIRPGAIIRVFTAPWKGTLKVHVRECYIKNPTDPDYTIGRGVNFPIEALEEVLTGLKLAKEAIEIYGNPDPELPVQG